ncbi:HpcH/HpaI aldolase/citrate lyase family protein [Rhizorhapis sp. SPR117]|uniref:HpcH/HpaI aldolase/citrate lyase family protein n=1 Tax=Rhizorhapis sp. SPR117 TaxID=2912611 RepID=UPI001F48D521|nr:CoA ester lyase [Rhizorhapis sp. SPR117]
MKLRSLLFVPGDRPERFDKAAASGADAVILDLEDSVASANKGKARDAVACWVGENAGLTTRIIRVNPIDSGLLDADLDAILGAGADALMLPKAEGAASVRALCDMMQGSAIPILPIASETPAAVFQLGSYAEVADRLCGLTWGAEDLPAAIGAATSREADGRYTPPYEVVRSLTLFGAHAAGVPAIETVFPAIDDTDGLATYAARGRRDGYVGMMAIHPVQVPTINAAFTPDEAEIAHARAVIAAFEANPDAGVLQLDGKMIDRPHIKQAERVLALAGVTAD